MNKKYLQTLTTIFLSVFFVAWLISFCFYFGAAPIFILGVILFGFDVSTPAYSHHPYWISSIYYIMIFLYYLFPVICWCYFTQVIKAKREKSYHIIWLILPWLNIILFVAALIVGINIEKLAQKINVVFWKLPTGNYIQTCHECTIDQNILYCKCATKRGWQNSTTFQLPVRSDKQLQNCDGQLMAVDTCPN